MEKNVALKYWRESISTNIYTLNHIQVKKGAHSTPFELLYGYSPNIKYFKVFWSKCYIFKDFKNGKLDAKSEKGIFLGYSTKSKSYNCLNTNTNKVVESENVKIDEFVETNDVECKEEPKDYSTVFYVDNGASNTHIEQAN